MHNRGVFIHDPGRLGAATAVSAVEVENGDGVLTEDARKRDAVVDRFDAVMSHSSDCSLPRPAMLQANSEQADATKKPPPETKNPFESAPFRMEAEWVR